MAVPWWLLRRAPTRVTRDGTPGSYVRSDGGTDATMLSCSTGRRTQNEPSVAVGPRNASIVAAGSNDYCAEIGGRGTLGEPAWCTLRSAR